MIEWFKKIILENFAAITGLLGVGIGGWIANQQFTRDKKLDFYEKQLREFYSPLVGIREEIRVLGEFRLEGEQASFKWWEKICSYGKDLNPDKSQPYYEQEGKYISTQIKYENMQLNDKIIPGYRKMVQIFLNNYWLAEEETKKYLPVLIKFVETWERYLSGMHPMEVIQQIQVKEEALMPFYAQINETHKKLREKLKNRKL